MDGLLELVPPSTTFNVGGIELRISQLRVADYAQASAHLLSKRPPLEEALPKILAQCPDQDTKNAVAGYAFTRAMRGHVVPTDELLDWLNSDPEGMVWFWWLRLKRHQPDITLDQTETLLQIMDAEHAAEVRRINQLLSETPLGNSPGPGKPQNGDLGPGEKSSENSPRSMDSEPMMSAA